MKAVLIAATLVVGGVSGCRADGDQCPQADSGVCTATWHGPSKRPGAWIPGSGEFVIGYGGKTYPPGFYRSDGPTGALSCMWRVVDAAVPSHILNPGEVTLGRTISVTLTVGDELITEGCYAWKPAT